MTIEYIKTLLDYDKKRGVFKWRVGRGGKNAGSIAGTKEYINIVKQMFGAPSYRLTRSEYLEKHFLLKH